MAADTVAQMIDTLDALDEDVTLQAGAARLLWATPHFGPNDLAYYNDQGRVRLVGVVADEPDVRDTHQNLRLRAESLTRAEALTLLE